MLEIIKTEQLGLAVDILGIRAEGIFIRYLLKKSRDAAESSNPEFLNFIYESAKEFQAFSENGFK